MQLKKYERWPFAFIDKQNRVWRRCKVKGWFEITSGERGKPGYTSTSKYLTHPDFIWCKKVMTKKELNTVV